MYHEIVPDEGLPRTGRPVDVHQRYADLLPRRLFVTETAFRAQMELLRAEGATTIGLDDVRSFVEGRSSLPERAILLTFDDLYQSVRYRALPVLRELGFRAVGFVVHDWVFPEAREQTDELSRTLSWPELHEMSDVFEYAHHSAGLHTRGEHGTAVERAPRDLLVQDTRRGTQRLDAPDVYAYPFGAYTDQTVEWLAESGITLAFTTQPGYNTATTPPLALHRDAVLCDTGVSEISAFLR